MRIDRKLLAGLLAVSLGVSALMPATAAAQDRTAAYKTGAEEKIAEADGKNTFVSEAIEEMLAKGNYAEGEAVAIVRGAKEPDAAGEAVLLARVGADAVRDVIEDQCAEGTAAAAVAAQRMQAGGEDSFTIWQVRGLGRSAREILFALYEDKDVIAAEPDYMAYAAVEEEETKQENAAEAATEEPAKAETIGKVTKKAGAADMSPMQWYLANTSEIYTTPLSPEGGYCMGVPGWQSGRADENAPDNASGTVCVMDTGIDTEHPDLQGVLYEFTQEQQEKYGCGKYGYNASGDDSPVNGQRAVDTHGTHVAGIIAANWDGEGVSGVAKGVKIFSVNVFGGNGSVQEMKSVLKGFQFLIDVAQEVNLKAVNCSWGTVQPQFALSVMIEELGRKGVNTVIASGNRYCDLDESIDLGSQTRSEFAIVVDAASPDGSMTDFSCYGQDSTDVFAPGGDILSAAAHVIEDSDEYGVYSCTDNTRFFPEASKASTLQTGIERFDADEPGVLFWSSNPAIDPEAEQIGRISTKSGFDDKRSAELRLKALPREEMKPGGGFSAVNGYVYMTIPVNSADKARWIGVKTAMSDGYKPAGGIDSITCRDEKGNPVEIDCACVSALKKGWGSGAFYTFYQCQWTPLSYNIEGYIEASNEVHSLLEKGMSESDLRSYGLLDYKDPGRIEGVYEWVKDEQAYLIARIGIGELTQDSRQDEVTAETALLVDNVAVGNKKAFTGSYMVMSGTSMAAPAVTGCLAVIAKDEPESRNLSEEELEEAARERAAKLLAAVDHDESLGTLCRTGGRVNLHGQTEFTVKAPLISSAQAEEGVLKVEGWYFGTGGTLAVDDREIETKRWEDGRIEANIGAIPNGSHVVKVTNADGAVSRAVFSASSERSEGRRFYGSSHSLPLREKAFIEDNSDRIYGPAAYCGGRIYTMAVTAKYFRVQGMWYYDIAEDTWSQCSLPDGYNVNEVRTSSLAALNDRLYLCGSYESTDENGEETGDAALWRYEPYGDFWERLEIDMPTGVCGICALKDTLFAAGVIFTDAEDAEDAEDSEEDEGGEEEYSLGFYRIDLTGRKTSPVSGRLPAVLDGSQLILAPSSEYIYVYASYGFEYDMKTLSGGEFLRVSYDGSREEIAAEDLTGAFEEALGKDFRTEFETKSGDEPTEHFALAGIGDGAAIIGGSVPGEDTHIIYDTDDKAVVYDRTSSYHRTTDPLAVYGDGTLYVIGCNTTEPDIMYFRSDRIAERTAQEIPPKDSKLPDLTQYIGILTVAFFALILGMLTAMRKK